MAETNCTQNRKEDKSVDVAVKKYQAATIKKQPSKKRRISYFITWLFLWPGILLIPILMVGGAILVDFILPNMADRLIYGVNLMIFIMVGVLAVVLLAIKVLLRRAKRLFLRVGGLVLGGYIWLGVLFGGLLMLMATNEIYLGRVLIPEMTKDARLMQIVEDIGGAPDKLENVAVSYVEGYEDKNRAGEYSAVYNSDINNSFAYATMTIKKGQKTEDEKDTIAHEYLHHIWETQLDDKTLHNLTSQLMTLYGDDEWMKQRVATYSDTDMLVPTELFSFYCTESSDGYLTKYVLNQCSKYIDRSSLQFLR